MKDLVHYKIAKDAFALATACREWPTPQKQIALAPLVTCPACLDWIASNHKRVIADVAKLRRSA